MPSRRSRADSSALREAANWSECASSALCACTKLSGMPGATLAAPGVWARALPASSEQASTHAETGAWKKEWRTRSEGH